MPPSRRGKLLLIDAFSLLYRAFYALPDLRTSDGRPTQAVYGFAQMLFRLLADENPDYVIVVTDRPGPTFRDNLYEAYKAQRPEMPDDLAVQIPVLFKLIDALNIPVVGVEGYEADDCLGTLARLAREAGLHTVIVTGDRDTLQLVNDAVEVVLTRRGIKDIERLDAEGVREKLGVAPELVPDLKALTGDSSDNIPGVPGVGPKTAVRWLERYGSVEALLRHAEEIEGKAGENLRGHAEQVLLSKKLATIDTRVPLDVSWEKVRRTDPDWPRLESVLLDCEFHSLWRRLRPAEASDGGKVAGAAQESHPALEGQGGTGEPAGGGLEAGSPIRIVDEADAAAAFKGVEGARSFGIALALAGEHPLEFRAEAAALAWEGGPGIIAFPAGGQCPAAAQLLRTVVADPERSVVVFDAKTMSHALSGCEGLDLSSCEDAMLAAYLLNPGQGTPRPEDVIRSFLGGDAVGAPQPQARSNAGPAGSLFEAEAGAAEGAERHLLALADGLRRTWPVLREKLREQGLERLYREVELPLWPVLAEMERNGVRIDCDYLRAMGKEMESRLARMSEEIYRMAGERFNVNSPRQLAAILYEKLGLPVLKRTKTGPSTDASVLEELAVYHDLPAALLAYRQVAKLKSTYVDALPALVHPATGRVHTTFNQAVTATGRLSSTHPNLQNIPVRTEEGRLIRGAFIAEEGDYVLLSADYSQIELRVLAHLSGDEGLIEAFRRGEDIHTRTAAEVFGLTVDAVTPQQRAAAKAINFGIIYGISSFGLSRGTGLSIEEAQRYIESYFQRYPGVKAYLDGVVARARSQGFVTTLMGRRRPLPEINSRQRPRRQFAERTAMNTPIQGSAADIIKMSMIRLFRRLKAMGAKSRLLLQVHDELLLECPRGELEQVARAVKEEMEGAVQLAVPLEVELRAGPNWKDTEPLHL